MTVTAPGRSSLKWNFGLMPLQARRRQSILARVDLCANPALLLLPSGQNARHQLLQSLVCRRVYTEMVIICASSRVVSQQALERVIEDYSTYPEPLGYSTLRKVAADRPRYSRSRRSPEPGEPSHCLEPLLYNFGGNARVRQSCRRRYLLPASQQTAVSIVSRVQCAY